MKKILFAALLAGVALPADAATFLVTGTFAATTEVLANPGYAGPAAPPQSFSLQMSVANPVACTLSCVPDSVSFNFGGFTATSFVLPYLTTLSNITIVGGDALDGDGVRRQFQLFFTHDTLAFNPIATFVVLRGNDETQFIYRNPTVTSFTVDDAFRLNPPTMPGPVPEPTNWAMMIGGFALVGAAMRRRAEVAFT